MRNTSKLLSEPWNVPDKMKYFDTTVCDYFSSINDPRLKKTIQQLLGSLSTRSSSSVYTP